MTQAGRYLVFDVGGTQLRGAVYDGPAARLADVCRVDAPSYLRHPGAPWSELRAQLVDAMSSVRSRVDPSREVSSAVVAFPGPVDAAGLVLAAPTLWGDLGQYPFALDRDLSGAWSGVDVHVVNDVTAAGYRYVGAEDDDFCIVTISSGIGNKVFVRGRPLLGRSGHGGEIGHLQVDASPTAAPCDCGGRGHLGAIASGRGMLWRAKERAASGEDAFGRSMISQHMRLTPDTLTAEALAEGYRVDDPWATAVVREGADALALVLAAIHLSIGVERFVLVGGFALGLGARFCDDVHHALASRCWQSAPTRVLFGEPDGHCALFGAGRARHLGLLTATPP